MSILNTKIVLPIVAEAITLFVGARIVRYEPLSAEQHRNRYTGALCKISEECWFPKHDSQ